jgi:transglutaminase-like putative cysteine protease
MQGTERLSDHDHPVIVDTVNELTKGKDSVLEKLEALFYFVRDRIPFAFPARFSDWDTVRASKVVESGFGYCNTKATLLVALCTASGIPARVHYGLIDAQIMRGIFPSFAFPFLPKAGPHSWTEVEVDGDWKPIDSYINDKTLFRASHLRLQSAGRSIGYSLACIDGKCSCEFNFGERGFAQMGAVVKDRGVWEDASQFFATGEYVRFNAFQRLFYPVLAAICNSKINRLRASMV